MLHTNDLIALFDDNHYILIVRQITEEVFKSFLFRGTG